MEKEVVMRVETVQIKKKPAGKACGHKRLVFLGKQGLPGNGDFLALFNCADCQSTISLKMKKKAQVKVEKESVPALKRKIAAGADR